MASLFLLGLSAVVLAVMRPLPAGAQACAVSDVSADWSDEGNPNGTWSYQEGTNPLPQVDWWQRVSGGWTRAQPGWADSEDANTRSPFWFRSNGYETFEHDYHRCDVVVHTSDDVNGVGNGPATLLWTSPFDGAVSITGAVWMARDIGRGNDWKLYRNDTLLTQGSITSGDPYSRSVPFFFRDGSGGADAVADLAVETGDTLSLVFQRTTQFGELVGVKMRIGCGQPTSSSSTTTTTLFYPQCGDPIYALPDGQPVMVNASDALLVLRAAVGADACDVCVCDPNDSGGVNATDALVVLRVGVGADPRSNLNCPFCPC